MSSAATVTKVKTQFARKASNGGGIGLNQAMAAAEARLDGMREQAIGQIDEGLADIDKAALRLAADPEGANAAIKAACDALVGLCGVFGLAEMGRAAFSLCRLIDMTEGAIPPSAVAVHVRTMKFLRSADPAAVQGMASTLLGQLDVMCGRLVADAKS